MPKKADNIMNKMKKGCKKCFVTDTELPKEKKLKQRKYTRNRYRNVSKKDKQKLKERRTNRIHSMSQENLEQLEQKTREKG